VRLADDASQPTQGERESPPQAAGGNVGHTNREAVGGDTHADALGNAVTSTAPIEASMWRSHARLGSNQAEQALHVSSPPVLAPSFEPGSTINLAVRALLPQGGGSAPSLVLARVVDMQESNRVDRRRW